MFTDCWPAVVGLSGVAYNDGRRSAMVNFHLPLPQDLHAQIAEFAAEHAGSPLDLDEDLERAAIEVLIATDRS